MTLNPRSPTLVSHLGSAWRIVGIPKEDESMPLDLRAEAARYYALNPNMLADVPFYIDRLPKPGVIGDN